MYGWSYLSVTITFSNSSFLLFTYSTSSLTPYCDEYGYSFAIWTQYMCSYLTKLQKINIPKNKYPNNLMLFLLRPFKNSRTLNNPSAEIIVSGITIF